MLDVIFHVAEPEIFYQAGIELKDYDNNVIPAGTPNVYVPIETADTFYRFRIDDILEQSLFSQLVSSFYVWNEDVKNYMRSICC